MKKTIIISVFLMLSTFIIGQTINDKQTLIQMCIDYKELQPLLTTKTPLIISYNGVIPTDLQLSKFNQSVKFMTKEERFFNNRLDYLEFTQFQLSESSATIIMRYEIKNASFTLNFEKKEGKWLLN